MVGDHIINEMVQEILLWRRTNIPTDTMRRWVEHLRDDVNPKIDELQGLKARKAAKTTV